MIRSQRRAYMSLPTCYFPPMDSDERITVTLTDDMAQAIRGAIESGDYVSGSDVMREALQVWMQSRGVQESEIQALRSDLLEGMGDIQAGRVRDYSADDIISLGEQRLPSSGSGYPKQRDRT